jgi:hypothetical protein
MNAWFLGGTYEVETWDNSGHKCVDFGNAQWMGTWVYNRWEQPLFAASFFLTHMLIFGTCNPEGYGNETYEGLYLTDSDIKSITPTMPGVPVKIEHRGSDVGKVVSAWVHEVSWLNDVSSDCTM